MMLCHKTYTINQNQHPAIINTPGKMLLSMSLGVDYLVIAFDMEIQPLVTHNAARPLCSVRAYMV